MELESTPVSQEHFEVNDEGNYLNISNSYSDSSLLPASIILSTATSMIPSSASTSPEFNLENSLLEVPATTVNTVQASFSNLNQSWDLKNINEDKTSFDIELLFEPPLIPKHHRNNRNQLATRKYRNKR